MNRVELGWSTSVPRARRSVSPLRRPRSFYFLKPFEKIQRGKIAKGDVLAVAQVAGVMGAKKTPDLIPMCHPILLTSVDISFKEEPQPESQKAAAPSPLQRLPRQQDQRGRNGSYDSSVGRGVDHLRYVQSCGSRDEFWRGLFAFQIGREIRVVYQEWLRVGARDDDYGEIVRYDEDSWLEKLRGFCR